MHIGTDFHAVDEAVVLDLETTGFQFRDGARIVSVALLRVSLASGEVSDAFYQIYNPQVPIPPAATAVHGLSDHDVAEKPALFVGQAEFIRRFIGDLPVICHNVAFDIPFLHETLSALGVKGLDRNATLCTMLAFQSVIGQSTGSRLTDAVRFYSLPMLEAHNARSDAEMTFQVALKLRLRGL